MDSLLPDRVLFKALEHGDRATVEQALDSGVLPDATCDGLPLLAIAAFVYMRRK